MLTRCATLLGLAAGLLILVSCDDGDCPGKDAEIQVNISPTGVAPPITLDQLVLSASTDPHARTLQVSYSGFRAIIPTQEIEGTQAEFGDVTLRTARIELDGETYSAVLIRSDHATKIIIDSDSTP